MKSLQLASLVALTASAVGAALVLSDSSVFGTRPVAGAEFDRPDAEPTEHISAELIHEVGAAGVDRQRRPGFAEHDSVSQPGRSESGDGTAPSDAMPGGPQVPRKAPTLAEIQEFREYVDGTISEMREEQAADDLRRLRTRIEKLDETMPALEVVLDLTAAQSDKLRTALLTGFDREAEYLRLWAKGADEQILAELKTSDRAALVRELSSFLSAEQLALYHARGQ